MFKVGEKVFKISDFGGTLCGVSTVSKVYKNGNFIIDGFPQQFRQDGRPAGRD